MERIAGFSKLSKQEKINWIASQLNEEQGENFLKIDRFWQSSVEEQKVLDEFSENTISNFYTAAKLSLALGCCPACIA